MIILGLILLVVGWLIGLGILEVAGGILLLVGVILLLVSAGGRQVGPYRHYW